MTYAQLKARAEAWIAQDPDPTTQDELKAILAAGPSQEEELAERFCGPLAFGTAGLRGIIGAGESLMNRAVVVRTARGLGTCLLEQMPEAARERGVVVGYDGRRLSREFAADTAEVLTALGIPVRVSSGTCPTPLLAYAVTRHQAAAGVMVTASHNPPQYNGYKVYAQNGAQIIPPFDRQIAAAIDAAPGANEVPRLSLEQARADGLLHDLGAELEDEYLAAIAALSRTRAGDRSLGIVYTPLHGVGYPLTQRALSAAGFDNFHVVAEQRDPDGAFPTVAFPNPEEPGALDLALALAKQQDARLILANDPDADRLAAVVRQGDDWIPLTGNEIGVLLGNYTLGGEQGGARVVMASIVSSPQLSQIAAARGVRYEETLTGFKWIANRGLELEPEGVEFVFGYEEALGYTVGNVVRDKDGISAALLLAELAALRHAEGKTLLDELEVIARETGVYVSGQKSTVFPGREGPEKMAAILQRLREDPPEQIGGLDVLAVRDYQTRLRTPQGGEPEPLTLPKSNVLTYELTGGNRIIARPSGTEPKIKFYFDVREPIAAGETFAAAKARAAQAMDALRDAFVAIAT